MRRIAFPAIAALLVGGCSPSSAGQLGVNRDAALTASCPSSSMAPDIGFGPGPAYLSGQISWYSGGQAVALMVDSRYTGPLLVRGSELGGDGLLRITLADLPHTDLANIAAKESQHAVVVVSAIHTPEGGLALQADLGSPTWRAWFGRLSTDGPGCFAIQVDGTAFTEVIKFAVHAGPAPPG